jgi:hypothetical protein
VSFDISRAFDGVPTAQLLALAQRLLARPAYTIVKYSEVCRRNSASRTVDQPCQSQFVACFIWQ